MYDTLVSGKSIRSLNIIDDFNREVLTLAVDNSLSSGRVIRESDKPIEWRRRPDKICSDNGPEFISDKIAG